MTALAAQADVEAELGRTLTDAEAAKIDAALASASRVVRRVTGRRYEAGTFTVRRRAYEAKVFLDQPSSVASVLHHTPYGAQHTLTNWTLDPDEGSIWGVRGDVRWVKVTYTVDAPAEGESLVPADVVAVCAKIAARGLTSSVPTGAIAYLETRGPFSSSAHFKSPSDVSAATDEELRTLAQFALPRNGPLALGPSHL